MLRAALLLALASSAVGCSDKTKAVSWEEEVKLASGETLWVQRTDTFVEGSEPGNPFRMAWWPDKRRYTFTWKGVEHSYQTPGPRESLGAVVLHMRGDTPVIVDRSKACAQPGFAEFVWDGKSWARQGEAGPDVMGQPRNLMYAYDASQEAMGTRIMSAEKRARDTSPHGPQMPMQLSPEHMAKGC
jgi:hypothetical protein